MVGWLVSWMESGLVGWLVETKVTNGLRVGGLVGRNKGNKGC